METYTEDFYRQRYSEPIPAYKDVLAYVLELFPNITSAVDVGCVRATGWQPCANWA